MKFRVVCRKVYDCVRYDLREIAFPSSLPDPLHIKKRPKLTWKDKWCILKEATRLYGASWVRDIGPELVSSDQTTTRRPHRNQSSSNTEEATSEPTVLEDLAATARGGVETLKPTLWRIYMTRALLDSHKRAEELCRDLSRRAEGTLGEEGYWRRPPRQ